MLEATTQSLHFVASVRSTQKSVKPTVYVMLLFRHYTVLALPTQSWYHQVHWHSAAAHETKCHVSWW